MFTAKHAVNWVAQAEELDVGMRQEKQSEYDAGLYFSDSDGGDESLPSPKMVRKSEWPQLVGLY